MSLWPHMRKIVAFITRFINRKYRKRPMYRPAHEDIQPPASQGSSGGEYHSSGSSGSTTELSSGSSGGESKEEGYDPDLFLSPVEDKYLCPICLLMLRNPMQTECGHRFCNACILRWLREKAIVHCPLCQTLVTSDSIFRDNFAKREINNMKVKCENYRAGCEHTCELSYLQVHLQTCKYTSARCIQCDSLVQKRHLMCHLQDECPRRIVKCHCCGLDVVFSQKQMHLYHECPSYIQPCSNCKKDMPRRELEDHVANVCPNTIIPCIYHDFGCPAKAQRQDMAEHLDASIQDHLLRMGNAVREIRNETGEGDTTVSSRLTNLESTFGDMSITTSGYHSNKSTSIPSSRSLRFATPSTHQSLESIIGRHSMAPPIMSTGAFSDSSLSVRSGTMFGKGAQKIVGTVQGPPDSTSGILEGSLQHKQLRRLNSQPSISVSQPAASALEKDIKELKEKNNRKSEKLAKLEKQNQELLGKNTQLERRLSDCVQRLKKHEAMIKDLELRCHSGVFIWKLHDYKRKKREAMSGDQPVIHSPGFYSSFNGYKLCIRLNLNGIDTATNSHLSLFVHFMQGDYDDILQWPFKGKITLTILDQNRVYESRQHISETLSAQSHLAAFQRPTSHRNHKGFGYMEFAPITLIESNTFIKEDTLVIKVKVIED